MSDTASKENTKPAESVVIRRGKDTHGYSVQDVSSCCQSPLVYLDQSSWHYNFYHKFEDGRGTIRCFRCNRKVNG